MIGVRVYACIIPKSPDYTKHPIKFKRVLCTLSLCVASKITCNKVTHKTNDILFSKPCHYHHHYHHLLQWYLLESGSGSGAVFLFEKKS